jgi:hypothetical protein
LLSLALSFQLAAKWGFALLFNEVNSSSLTHFVSHHHKVLRDWFLFPWREGLPSCIIVTVLWNKEYVLENSITSVKLLKACSCADGLEHWHSSWWEKQRSTLMIMVIAATALLLIRTKKELFIFSARTLSRVADFN